MNSIDYWGNQAPLPSSHILCSVLIKLQIHDVPHKQEPIYNRQSVATKFEETNKRNLCVAACAAESAANKFDGPTYLLPFTLNPLWYVTVIPFFRC